MKLATPRTLYFVVSDRKSEVHGYTWRVGVGGTSFYLKARAPEIGLLKISLHGPDPRPELSAPGFKLGIDHSALPKVEASGGAFFFKSFPGDQQWFTGRQINKHVKHVATFRSAPEMFQPGVPSAPNPGDFNLEKERGLVIPSPSIFKVADVDLFISDGSPYWWSQIQAFREKSCFGPIQNKAGQYLTGQSIRRPTAVSKIAVPKPIDASDRLRGVVAYLNTDQVLIVEERWMSKSYAARRKPQ